MPIYRILTEERIVRSFLLTAVSTTDARDKFDQGYGVDAEEVVNHAYDVVNVEEVQQLESVE